MIKKEISDLYIGNLSTFESNCIIDFLSGNAFPYKKHLKDNFSIIDKALISNENGIEKILKEQYGFEVSQFILEQYKVWLYIRKYVLKDPDNFIDEQLLERIYSRIKLIKEGWSDESIEKFIITYFKDYINYTEIDTKIIKWTYHRLRNILIIKKSILGRPKIPPCVNSIIIKYKKTKNREKMREKYNIEKDLYKLFSKEEIDNIVEIIKSHKADKENTIKQFKNTTNHLGAHYFSSEPSYLFNNVDTIYDPILKKLEVLKKYT